MLEPADSLVLSFHHRGIAGRTTFREAEECTSGGREQHLYQY